MKQAQRGALLAVVLTALGVGSAVATVVAGGGRPAKTDCYSVFEVAGSKPAKHVTLECMDGDPDCDTDGECENGCAFQVRLCPNQNGRSCTSPGLKRPPKVHGASLAAPPSLTGTDCGSYSKVTVGLRRKGKKPGSKKVTVLAVGTDRKRDADTIVLRCLPRPAGPCPAPTSTSTTLSSTTSTTSTTVPCPPIPPRGIGDTSCCGPERVTITGTGGTLKVGGFMPFPFPAGVATIIEAGAPDATCKHSVVIPPNGFVVPPFCIPALGYTSQVTTTGCESGAVDSMPFPPVPLGKEKTVGTGFLWDGNAGAHGGVPMTNVTKVADSSDGPCDPGSGTCATDDNNFLGDIDETRSAGGDPQKIAIQLDIPAHSRTWQDTGPGVLGMCTSDGVYEPADGDTLITEFDFILSPTTGTSTGQFVDKNANGCALPAGSAGFGAPSSQCSSPAAGPCGATGIQADGPCCTVGQSATVVTVGMAFSNSFPLYDLGFINVVPNTVSQCCVSSSTDTCTVSTNACQQ